MTSGSIILLQIRSSGLALVLNKVNIIYETVQEISHM